MPTAELDDIEIYYEESGQGEPVLLAPPSWWPSDTWKVGVVPFLSKRYRTIIFDCRGTGYSSKPDHGYTISQFAKDCAGLLKHLSISKSHAVGFALGGQIVQALAIVDRDSLSKANGHLLTLRVGDAQHITRREQKRRAGLRRQPGGHPSPFTSAPSLWNGHRQSAATVRPEY